MIELDQVWFGYVPEIPILAGVSLELRPGLSLLVGPNGCGKSTLLKVAAGVELPAHGWVKAAGLDLWQDEIAARRNLAYLPEQAQITIIDPGIFVAQIPCWTADRCCHNYLRFTVAQLLMARH